MFVMFWHNFLTYDWVVFALALLNVWIFRNTLRYARRLQKRLLPEGYVPGGTRSHLLLGEHYQHYLSAEGERELLGIRRKMNLWAAYYTGVTAIFPLLGILGTVIALIQMVHLSAQQANTAFFSALTSTLWGLVFAIVYKALNGYVSAAVDGVDELYDLYLERNSQRLIQTETADAGTVLTRREDA